MEKFLLSIKLLFIGIFISFTAQSTACTYTFKLYDLHGDGWNNGFINILVNGNVVAQNITLNSGYGPGIFHLNVSSGDSISTVYVAGNWPEENYYEVYDPQNQLVHLDGCLDYSCTPQGGFIAIAVCPDIDVGVTAWLDPYIGCSLSANEPVTIAVKNFGITVADTFYLSYSIDGGTTFYHDTVYQSINPGDTLFHTFSQLADFSSYGDFLCIATVKMPGDQFSGNDTLHFTIKNSPLFSTFPYFENFELGDGGWYSGGVNSSWELGVPSNTIIDSTASGSNAWVTGLNGSYNNNEASWVASPCFDFTTITNPVFEMKIWLNIYDDWGDGVALQYTINDVEWHTIGQHLDEYNWYNRDWIEGLNAFNTWHGWSGVTNGYMTVRRELPSNLAGQPFVRFRIVFGSNYWSVNEGIAFDDIKIFQPPPMSFSTATAFQNNLNVVGTGMKDQEILGLKIETISSTNPLQITEIRYNTTGSTSVANIDSAKVFYTGADSTFQATNPFGEPVKPSSPFAFNDTLPLLEGDNYLWLAYNVAPNATAGHQLDAVIDSMKISGIWYIPANNDPPGSRTILPRMSGQYTVNQMGGADYTSINEAIDDLNNRGVSGPVEINIVPGVYNEKIILSDVYGTSSTNRITFKSSTNDSTHVVIQDSAQNTENNYIVLLSGAKHYTFKYLTFKSLGIDYGRNILLLDQNIDIAFENNVFTADFIINYNTNDFALIFGYTDTEELVIKNNLFKNGSSAITLYSIWQYQGSMNTNITGNIFEDQYSIGINLENQFNLIIHQNLITTDSDNNWFYGLSLSDIYHEYRITSNKIHLPRTGYGIRVSYSNSNPQNPGIIANNFVTGTATTTSTLSGINTYNLYNAYIAFNSINIHSGNSSNSNALNITGNDNIISILNNILCNKANGYSINIVNSNGIQSDHNNFYHTGDNMGRINYGNTSELIDWQTITGFDQNSIHHDPMFMSLTDLHIFTAALKGAGIPVPGIIDDIDGDIRDTINPDIGADEFELPAQEVSFEGFLSPVSDCGLGTEDVIIRIANNGTAAITGGLTASYQISGNTPVSELVSTTILPGDTINFSFSTKPDLSVNFADSVFHFTCWLDLPGDPIPWNDSGEINIVSGWIPPAPIPGHTTVNYGTAATLTATGPGFKLWYENISDTLPLYYGDTITTPPLYDTTSFFVSAFNGQFGNDELTTMFSSNNGQAGNMFNIIAKNTITIDSFHVNATQSTLMEVWYRQGSYIGYQTTQTGWTKLGEYTVNAAGSDNATSLPVGGLTIPAGETYGIYITYAQGTGIRYTDGTGNNEVYSNDDMTLEAYHGGSRFNLTFTPRVWNGTVFYSIGDGGTASGCESPKVIVNANVTAYPGTDAGITQIETPYVNAPDGTYQDVTVTLKNYGLNQLTSVNITWALNGIVQGTFPWTGSLNHKDTESVIIDNILINAGYHCITAWTSQPNNLPDNFPANDSAKACFNACLNGIYTIGLATSGTHDFNSFNDAITMLSISGICDNVVFEVYPGIYNEQFVIGEINGADSNNTVVFKGVTGDSTDAVIQYAANTAANNYVVRFDKASFVTLKHLTIEATGQSRGIVIDFFNGTNTHNTITNCIIKSSLTSTFSTFICINSQTSSVTQNTTITNNLLKGGFYGLYWEGLSSTNNKNLIIENNTIKDYWYSGISAYSSANISFKSNLLTNRNGATTLYPAQFNSITGTGVFSKNKIISTGSGNNYGLQFNSCEGSISSRILVSNNFISQEGNPNNIAMGIQSLNSNYVDFYNNSVNITGGSTIQGRAFYLSGGNNINIINNIFSNSNYGYSYYINTMGAISVSDHNNFYTNGINLSYSNYTSQTSLSELQAATGKDSNSHSIEPPFTSTHNLKLKNTFLSGKATPLPEVNEDIYGNPRTTTPTIGAHEIPLLNNDAGVIAILAPNDQMTITEDDNVPVEVVIMNFGINTLTSAEVSYTVNNSAPVSITYNGQLAHLETDTISLPPFISPAGNTTICAYTTLSGDSNYFNDTTCITYFALSNIDAELTRILPLNEGCGLTLDTVKVVITNVAIGVLPAGYNISYQIEGNPSIVTETSTTPVNPGDSVIYTFNTLVDLSTSTDTIYKLIAWVKAQDDNMPENDTAFINIQSLALPPPPIVTSPVSTSFGTSTVLNATSSLPISWYDSETSTSPIAYGPVFQTPMLYDTIIYWAETMFGLPNTDLLIGTADTQNSSTTYPSPYGNWYWGNKEQYLILESELTAAGLIEGDITSLAFEVVNARGTPLQDFTIKMGETQITQMSTNFITTGLSTVYYDQAYVDVAGWNEHSFQTPFHWDGTSNIVVEVCFNNNSYTSNGVVYLSNTSFTSTVRSHGDVANVCGRTTGSTTSQRPVMKLSAISHGCASLRVPVQVNVTNMPPLGKPLVTPENINLEFTDCNETENRHIRIRNIGNANLQYTTFGGVHNIDTTSTQYYSGVTYPDTTSHFFTTIPRSIDSLFLEITINGRYNPTNATASLIIEGTYVGVIPDGSAPNGQDITVLYAFGGNQLKNWLSDGALIVEIGNSSAVTPWDGTRMHRIRAFTKPADWISMPQTTSSLAVGDSVDINVHFNAAGLIEGDHTASIPLEFDHPGYPYVTIPVDLSLEGLPEINAANCIFFDSIFQYNSITDSIVIYNEGCSDLVIDNITVSDTAFSPSFTQATVAAYDSILLFVTYNPSEIKKYSDTLTIFNNDINIDICLDAVSLSPPVISLSHDTIEVTITGCNDSISTMLTINNSGDATLDWYNVSTRTASIGSESFTSALAGPTYISSSTSSYWHSNHISLFTPTEIADNGSISSLAWKKADYNGYLHNNALFRIYLKETTSQNVPTTFGSFANEISGATLVYENNQQSLPADTGWTEFIFNTTNNFFYTGQNNLMVLVEWYRPNHATGAVNWYYSNASGKAQTWSGSSSPPSVSYSHNQRPNVKIHFSGVDHFVQVTPDSGNVQASGQQNLNLTFYASGLKAGLHETELIINSNDPVNSNVIIPVYLTIEGYPEISISHTGCLIFDTILQGASETQQVMIKNKGCDTLHITSLTTLSSNFIVQPSAMIVLPFDSSYIDVIFNPQTTGSLTDSVIINGNDGIHYLCLEGFSLPAPSIVLSDKTISVNIVECNDSTIASMQLINQGQGDLYVNIMGGGSNAPWLSFDTTAGTSVGWQPIPGIYLPGDNIAPFATVSASTCYSNPCSAFNNLDFGVCGTQQVWVSTSNPPTQTPHVNYIEFEWPSNVNVDGITIHHAEQTTRFLNGGDIYFWDGSQWVYSYSFDNLPMQCENTIHFPQIYSNKIRITSFRMTASGQTSNPTFREIEVHEAKPSIHVPPASLITINLRFNALGLNSGVYSSPLVFSSNDPLTPIDTVNAVMNVIGTPELRFGHTILCLDMDTVIQGFSYSDTIKIFNDGCDTLFIYDISNNYYQYNLSEIALTILPNDSANLIVDFTPDATASFLDTLVFITNDGQFLFCLEGHGIDAPVISYNPNTISHTFYNCIDSVIFPLTIYNSGIGDLRYNIPNLFNDTYDQTSTKYYNTTEATTHHTFHNVPLTADSIKLILTINGDFDSPHEYCWLYIEGNNMGVVDDRNLPNGTNIINEYTFTGSQVKSWLSNGILEISVVNNNNVDHWSSLVSMHRVQIIIDGIPWMELSKTSDTVSTGDSSVVMINMNTGNLANGTYYTTIDIHSNDPVNQHITIPCTLTVDGQPAITFSDSCLHVGQVMQYASIQDTLIIENSGCNTLTISSIYTMLPDFNLNVSYMTIQPGKQQKLIVTFSPTSVGQITDNIYLVTNAGNHTICLTGQGLDASILDVSPVSFNKTILNCNDTISDLLLIQNLGSGNLTYDVYGGRGLSGDSTVLIIRDHNPHGVNVEQYIIANFGISPDIITSNQVPTTNFSNYDLVITVGDQSTSYYTIISSEHLKFQDYVNSGGIVLYMISNVQIANISLAGNAVLTHGNQEQYNSIIDQTHPIVSNLNSPLQGSNANRNYFSTLPSNASIITETNITSQPTTIEYEIGSGLVIATGMLWEFHSTRPQFNMAPMLHNAISYALGNVGASPSWLSFDYVADTIVGIGSTSVTVNFNSTGIANGTYTSNIIVYSNDPINAQILIPCTLTVSGPANISYSPAGCIIFDTIIQGAQTTEEITFHNTGCDTLYITSIQSLSSDFTPSLSSATIKPGGSKTVQITFSPPVTGNLNSYLQVLSNVGNFNVCMEGYGINPPIVSVNPNFFDVTINSCSDTLSQTLTLSNTGAGDAVFQIMGLYGSDIDQTSHIPFYASGVTTTHNFQNIPQNIDTLILEITLSGDFDQPYEFATLIIEEDTIGQIDDGNLPAGTPYTSYHGFGGSQLQGWLNNNQLSIKIQNDATVDHWQGLNSYHRVRLIVKGNYWIELSHTTDTITSNNSKHVDVKFFSTNMNAGTHYFDLIIGSNDPGNAQVTIPCTLTVIGDADWQLDKTCLNFDSTMVGAINIQDLQISNTGCDTLFLHNISSDVTSIVPDISSGIVLPGHTLNLSVTFTPTHIGSLSGSLTITSNIGQETVCLTATGVPAPSMLITTDTLEANLACNISESKYLTIKNTGNATLNYQITPTSAQFISIIDHTGSIPAGDSLNVAVVFDKTGLQIGQYSQTLTIQSNDPLNPVHHVYCTMDLPHMLNPVDLGNDKELCANNTLTLNAGSGFISYLWDDSSTDSTRIVNSSGTYFVTVMDINNCQSSDTINVMFHPLPTVNAGSDTSICRGLSIIRNGVVTGTLQTTETAQVGTSNFFSSWNSITPFATGANASRSQMIYLKSDMVNSGFNRGWIESISFNVGSVGSPDMNNFNISIGTTSKNNLSESYIESLTNVYASINQSLTVGWNTFTFNTPFFYNGDENIVIEICFSNNSRSFSSSVQYNNTGFHASRYSTSNSAGINGCNLMPGSVSWNRPNIRFNGIVDQGTYSWSGPNNYSSSSSILKVENITQNKTGFYTLTVDNGLGCISSDYFSLTIAPTPTVNAGPDKTIYEGGSVQLTPAITGGLPPYNYQWSPGNTLNDSTLASPTASPIASTEYEFTVTGINGCSASDMTLVNVIPLFNISGLFTYNNAAYTPMTNSTVYLFDSLQNKIDSVVTDQSGGFTFFLYPPGEYYLYGNTDKAWGGVNSTDALVVQRHVINLDPLSGLRLKAADVNYSASITSVDALLILRRTLGLDTAFALGDWVYEMPLVKIENSNVQKNLQALATGDVNGSYTPHIFRLQPIVNIEQAGRIYPSENGSVQLPVYVDQNMNLGALTLFFNLPGEVISVQSDLKDLLYNVHQGRLKIAWSSELGHYFNSGDVLLTIHLKMADNSPDSFILQPTIESELADMYANVYEPANLKSPAIIKEKGPVFNQLIAYNQPNPLHETTTIHCILPSSGKMKIELFDMTGKSMGIIEESTLKAGSYSFNYDASMLPAGIYQYRITLETDKNFYYTNQSMVIIK